ncbi:MAG: C13 family peptidase, partial [Candidatus Thorarchaeota archaeon]|nr:C13 family peptidase [Candidatus Thorarchaeota archaeon]
FINPGISQEDITLQIVDITDGDKEQYIGQTLTLAGYLVLAAGQTLLVSNPLSFMNNSLNSNNFLLVSGNVVDDLKFLVGQQTQVKGVVEWADQPIRLLGLDYISHKEPETSAAKFLGCNDSLMSPESLLNFTPVIDTNPEKYAVLYSGGIDSHYAYYRYWNDLTWMYVLLLLNGYDPDNIYVIYKDGIGSEEVMPVHYPATHASMDTVFGILSSEMGSLDSLFFFSTNHGQYHGIYTWEALDPEPLNQTEVSDWFDSITCDHMVIIMEQCVSGKFIPYLTATNRVIMTACADDMSSYACDTEGIWDEFCYHLMSALFQFTLNGDGTPVWADVNDDGHISMAEAFGYAATMDSRIETPHYDDNGDGVGSTLGNIIGTDAIFGYSIFL